MGKASKLKKIRRIASQLPQIMVTKGVGKRVKGYDLISDGVTEVQGKPVQANDQYRRLVPVDQPINHNRRMKRLYNQYGAQGVGMYVDAVARHQASPQVQEKALIAAQRELTLSRSKHLQLENNTP